MPIKTNDIKKEETLISTGLVPIDTKDKEYKMLMSIYQSAIDQLLESLNYIKENLNDLYDHIVINTITSRIKSPTSIMNKMKKKNLELNYENLIKNINDVAGLRIICPLKSDIYTAIDIIKQLPNISILKEKDYITKPKKSGYSGYHIIVSVPVNYEGYQMLVKAEIQIRSMAMDFWATNEHKIKYKTDKKLSFIDSKRLYLYAKLLDILENKIIKLHRKQKMEE